MISALEPCFWVDVVGKCRFTRQLVVGWVLNGPQDVRLQKGEEIGPFILSSNVVMLFPENSIQLPADWISTRPLQMGEAMSNT